MLVQLLVRHFALIEDVSLEFGEGLNVLSGETGVGKSILIDAVKLLLGDRAQTRDIRYGEEEARVEGAFDMPRDPAFHALCEEAGIAIDKEDLLLLSRQVRSNGRNTCRINGQLLPLTQYRNIVEPLITIFGQKDRGLLQNPLERLELLDAYAGPDLKSRKKHLAEAYRKAQASGRAYQKAVREKQKAGQAITALQAKIDELGAMNLEIGQADRLRAEYQELAHWESLQEALASSQYQLYGSDQSAYNLLVKATAALEQVIDFQTDLPALIKEFKASASRIQDLNHELLNLKDRLPAQGGDLLALEERLALFDRLEKREGKSIDELVQEIADADVTIAAYDDMDIEIEDLQKRYIADRKIYQELAQKVSLERKAAAERLSLALEAELADLAMEQAKIRFVFSETAGRAHGIDEIEIQARTNPGMPFLPVADVASGGETSRLMLALQTVIGRQNPYVSYIFDEIDTGIGGMVLEKLGDKLMALSDQAQVICVTHAMPLAARADQLFVVAKHNDGDSTWTSVQALNNEASIHQELARMMGGQSDWHLNQARTLREEKHKA